MRGTYIRARQAYFPLWAPLLVSCAVLLTLDAILFAVGVRLGPVAGTVVGVTISLTICRAWIACWRHRHPRLTPEQFYDAQRRAAPWN